MHVLAGVLVPTLKVQAANFIDHCSFEPVVNIRFGGWFDGGLFPSFIPSPFLPVGNVPSLVSSEPELF